MLELAAGLAGLGLAGHVASEIRFAVGGDVGALLTLVLEPAACVAALWGLHRLITRLTLHSIGVGFQRLPGPLLLGVMVGGGVFGLGLLIASVHPGVSVEPGYGSFSDGLAAVVKAWEAGVWEEALFRGFG